MIIDPATAGAFVVINMGFALIPGPDVLYIVSQSVARGTRGGILACLGIACGTWVHIVAAAAGLTAVLTAIPMAFWLLKLAGAIYLVWIGAQMLRSSGTFTLDPAAAHRRIFVNGMLSNALNPKVAIFFVAFLPQFVDPARGQVALQIVVLGVLSILSGMAVNMVTASVAGLVRERLLSSETVRNLVQRVGGGILIFLGIRMVVSAGRS